MIPDHTVRIVNGDTKRNNDKVTETIQPHD